MTHNLESAGSKKLHLVYYIAYLWVYVVTYGLQQLNTVLRKSKFTLIYNFLKAGYGEMLVALREWYKLVNLI